MEAKCKDCGMLYGGEDWIDTVLSNEQWKIICPEDGILCANCIIKRASRLEDVYIAKMELKFLNEETEKRDYLEGFRNGYSKGREDSEILLRDKPYLTFFPLQY